MGLIQRLVGAVLGILVLFAAFVFASLALGVVLVVGLALWVWLWWRTRNRPLAGRDGTVIEGEYRDVTPSRGIEKRERL